VINEQLLDHAYVFDLWIDKHEIHHGIEYGFFRTDGKREFIEAAFCLECNTNNVVFDIPFDAMIKALEK